MDCLSQDLKYLGSKNPKLEINWYSRLFKSWDYLKPTFLMSLNYIQQIFTFNFRNLIVTSTGFTKEQKTELQVKVERMGGIYSNAFHDGVTHIICSLVRFVIRSIFHMKVINKVIKFSVDVLPTFLAGFNIK